MRCVRRYLAFRMFCVGLGQERGRGPDRVVLLPVGGRRMAEPPPPYALRDQHPVGVFDLYFGSGEDPAVVRGDRCGAGTRRSSNGCRSTSGSARARRTPSRRDHAAAEARGTTVLRGCARACRSRRARCGRTATTCSTPCTHCTARRPRCRRGSRPGSRSSTPRSRPPPARCRRSPPVEARSRASGPRSGPRRAHRTRCRCRRRTRCRRDARPRAARRRGRDRRLRRRARAPRRDA